MDPFLDLIQLLRPSAILWARIDAHGRWGVSFRHREDTLFCWVERGECQLVRPGAAPIPLGEGDFALVRTSTSFTLTTDPRLEPLDSDEVVAATGLAGMKLGEGTELPVILHGGRFVFDTANEGLLMALVPQVLHIAALDATSPRLRALLTMNRDESREPGRASAFVVTRLMELILLEILRSEVPRIHPANTGLLAGLADPVVAPALAAMHREVARPWTVASLARLCGVSRSGFSYRFRMVMSVGPIEYLQHWRIALAKDQLRRNLATIGEIALAIGFQSASAFSTAFTRAVGCSPSRFAQQSRR